MLSNVKGSGFIVAIAAALLVGCAGLAQQVEATKARGTIEAGGYTWAIPLETEGTVTVRTNGLPPKQAGLEAGAIACKKFDRIAQFQKQDGSLILGFQSFTFNCVK
jgi:hypothetical protein